MPISVLNRRSVLRLEGSDASPFLQGLVTNDVEGLDAGQARYAALLTPQGKILADFFVLRPPGEPDAFYLDVPAERASDLMRRLAMYKLRANVELRDVSESLAVAAAWNEKPPSHPGALWFADPRSAEAGFRGLIPRPVAVNLPRDAPAFEDHRIALGLPAGELDFDYGDAFPHEVGLDRLNGVDFKKGCYVGQEVISRMQHRGAARNRIVGVVFGGSAPAPGLAIKAGELLVGRMGSSSGSRGLAMLRLDRVDDAAAAGSDLRAEDGAVVRLAER